jgi:hypothetical protein
LFNRVGLNVGQGIRASVVAPQILKDEIASLISKS